MMHPFLFGEILTYRHELRLVFSVFNLIPLLANVAGQFCGNLRPDVSCSHELFIGEYFQVDSG